MKYVKKEDRYSILQNVYIFLNFLIVRVIVMVLRHFQQYFSYIVAVNFIGGENWSTRSKPPTCGSQWQTLSHNVVSSTPRLSGIRTHMVIILYVIQLSDRVYNVTFPAYALYSLRRISDRVYNVTFPAYALYSLRRRREYRA